MTKGFGRLRIGLYFTSLIQLYRELMFAYWSFIINKKKSISRYFQNVSKPADAIQEARKAGVVLSA
jgi:hypothetical protein